MMKDEESESPPSKRLKTDYAADNHYQRSAMDFTEDVMDHNGTTGDNFAIHENFQNFIDKDELDKLKEFQVLDEIKPNEDDSDADGSNSSDDGSTAVPDDEIEKMLDEDLPEGFKGAPKAKEKAYITRQKIVLEEKGINHFEVLPLDWMMVLHHSGIPVYLNKTARVCTLAKPYFLGRGSSRRHEIPLSAIPCLNYRRALEEEAKQNEVNKKVAEQIKNGTFQPINIFNTQTINQPSNVSAKIPKNNNEAKPISKSTMNEKTENTNNDDEINKCTHSKNNLSQNLDPSKAKLDKCDMPSHTFANGNSFICKKQDISNVTDEEFKSNVCPELHDGNFKENKEINYDAKVELCNNVLFQINIVTDNDCTKQSTDEDVSSTQFKSPVKSEEDSALTNCNEVEVDHCDDKTVKYNDEGKSKVDLFIKDSKDPDLNEQQTFCPFSAVNNANTDPQTPVSAEDSEANELVNNENGTKTSEQDSEIDMSLYRQPVILPGGIVLPPARVETIQKNWKSQNLTHEQVNDYCKKLFKFRTINIMHFKHWSERRKYAKARKAMQLQRPTLPEGTKLITIPAQPSTGDGTTQGILGGTKPNQRDWIMNMNGRSYLSVFHEYVRRALQKQPVYEFKQLENAATPYQATVFIGGMQYGVGYGTSKRQAKSAAARASIQILIPEMKDKIDEDEGTTKINSAEPDFSFFDYVTIEDPRITEFCATTMEPSPHAILRTCLLRNFGTGDRHIQCEMNKLEYQRIEFTMKVGKHTATVVCKNKKTAKQRASQAILQALHPHVKSWGSLLRLYGSRSVKSCKEKKIEEQEITLLQDKATVNEPNYAILDKLRLEMLRLKERDSAVVPIGTLVFQDDLPTHSGSNLNNVNL